MNIVKGYDIRYPRIPDPHHLPIDMKVQSRGRRVIADLLGSYQALQLVHKYQTWVRVAVVHSLRPKCWPGPIFHFDDHQIDFGKDRPSRKGLHQPLEIYPLTPKTVRNVRNQAQPLAAPY